MERTPEGWLRIAKTFLLYSKLGEKLWVGLEKGLGCSDSICLTITLLQPTGGARGSGVAVGRGGGAVGWEVVLGDCRSATETEALLALAKMAAVGMEGQPSFH